MQFRTETNVKYIDPTEHDGLIFAWVPGIFRASVAETTWNMGSLLTSHNLYGLHERMRPSTLEQQPVHFVHEV